MLGWEELNTSFWSVYNFYPLNERVFTHLREVPQSCMHRIQSCSLASVSGISQAEKREENLPYDGDGSSVCVENLVSNSYRLNILQGAKIVGHAHRPRVIALDTR